MTKQEISKEIELVNNFIKTILEVNKYTKFKFTITDTLIDKRNNVYQIKVDNEDNIKSILNKFKDNEAFIYKDQNSPLSKNILKTYNYSKDVYLCVESF
jgi:hypothetical protein